MAVIIDLTQLPRDAQDRITVIEAHVDQLLHEVSRCEDLIDKLNGLDSIAQFGFDASGAKFGREDERREARDMRTQFLADAMHVLFNGLAKEYWSMLAPDAGTFIQLLPAISEHVLSRCGREAEALHKANALVLEWRKNAYQNVATTQGASQTRPAGCSSSKRRQTPAEILNECKVKHKTTHNKLAEKMHLERSVYFDLKKGKRVSEETYLKAAQFIGCDPSDLKPLDC